MPRTRFIVGLLALTLFGSVAAVAFVQAQDPSRRWQAVNQPVAGQPGTNTRKRTSLAERLQGIRRSMSSEPTPATAEPAQPPQEAQEPTPAAAPETFQPVPNEQPSVVMPRPERPRGEDGFKPRGAAEEPATSVLRRPTAPVAEEQRTLRPPTAIPGGAADRPSSRRSVTGPTPQFVRSQSDRRTLLSGEVPALRVETSGPQAVVIGKEAAYTIRVVNEGETVARDIFVRVALPPWVQIVASDATGGAAQRQDDGSGVNRAAWTIDQLAGHAQEQLILKVSPQEGRAFDLTVEWGVRPASAFAQVEVQQPMIRMALNGPKDILYGETQVYTITLMNPGNGDAENVTVDLAPGQIGSEPKLLGQIAAGQQKQIEVEMTARQAGFVEIHAVATAEGGLQAEIAERVLVRRADLKVQLAGPKLKFAGSPAAYQVRVANTGDAPAKNVVASMVLPVGVKYLGGLQDANVLGRAINWPVGTLEPGGEREFGLQCELATAGEVRLELRTQGDGDLAAGDTIVTQVEALADLKLTVSDPDGPQAVGQPVQYLIKIVNRGTKAAEQVNVLAQFSEGVEPSKAEGWRAELVPGQVLFQPIPRIDAGQEVTLKISAVAEREGNHRFRAEVKCVDPETRLVSEETTRFFGESATPRTTRKPAALLENR